MAFVLSFIAAYPLALVIHVLAASLLIGGSLILPIAHRALLRAETNRDLGLWLGFMRDATRWHPIAALVLLLTGAFMGARGHFWTDGWFIVAALGWLANAGLANRFLNGSMATLGRALAASRGETITADVDALRRTPAFTHADDSIRAIDGALLYLMFNKPTFSESLAVVVFAVVMAAALRLALTARATRPEATVTL